MEPWIVWLVTVVVGWMLGFLSAYFVAKGKNLAMIKDVGKITAAVEDVKQKNRVILKRLGLKHQLRMAALERRLQAHQDAYALWWELKGKLFAPDIGDVVVRCQEWWAKNSLYLSADAREAFPQAYIAANLHAELKRGHADAHQLRSSFDTIMRLGPLLVAAVQLPPLGVDEGKTTKATLANGGFAE